MTTGMLETVSRVSRRLSSNLFSNSSAPARRQSRRFRPAVGLDRLESRDVPSSVMGPDPTMGAYAVTITVSNQDNMPVADMMPPPAPMTTSTPPADPGLLILVPPPATNVPTVPPIIMMS
jgi:hypothetical protein